MVVKLLRKENVDSADPAESLLPYKQASLAGRLISAQVQMY